MSQDRNPITMKHVLYEMPGVDAVTVRRDVEFRGAGGGALAMDVYAPPGSTNATSAPAVVIVEGYPDAGFKAMLGCSFKDMASSVSWARLIAASGMIAITYTNREPASDLDALFVSLRENAGSLGIDATRLGAWACSGHGPLGLSLMMSGARARVACAALCYPLTMDLDGATGVADAAARFRFANACAGKSLDDLSCETPVFVARAGRDEMPGLNDALDRFVQGALARNVPLAFTNHAAGPHAFDLLDDSHATRTTVRQILAFLQCHLGG